MNFWREPDFGWRLLCFLACIPSGGALLAKVFGIAPLQAVTLYLFLPCALFLVGMWWWASRTGRDYLAGALTIGFWGGLLGTLAYDLARIPFLLAGQRVFAPINVYGVWLAEAAISSQWTHALGWAYHFSNGITFGIMYALFMRRRHWLWAIPWALLLETIAVLSPFAVIFNLVGNYNALAIAYLGHVAYALPLGWLVYRWDDTLAWLAARPGWLRRGWPVVGLLLFLLVALWPPGTAFDSRAQPGSLRVEDNRLNPGWVRINVNDNITFTNPAGTLATIIDRTRDYSLPLAAGQQESSQYTRPGIYQVYVQTTGQTRSSFVIVEPVEKIAR